MEETETSQSALRAVLSYLVDNSNSPFFVAVDDCNEYNWFVSYLTKERHIPCVHLHDFCKDEDSFPDFDALRDRLITAHGAIMLLGLGDAVRLFASNAIGEMRDLVLSAKVIVPCRGAKAKLR